MVSNQKVQCHRVVQTCEDSSHQVLHHGIVLILATAVVSMQTGSGFTKAIMAEKRSSMLTTVFAPLFVYQ